MSAWLRGDAPAAASLVDALAATAAGRDAVERQYLADFCANLNGALGSPSPASQIVSRAGPMWIPSPANVGRQQP